MEFDDVTITVFPTRVGVYQSRSTCWIPASMFSPHAWGCTVCARNPPHNGISFPHTRGGVPRPRLGNYAGDEFSPHAWGCTGYADGTLRVARVFPTRVGVYRSAGSRCPWSWRFSPHAWGCTASGGLGGEPADVFPTRVGVYRRRAQRRARQERFPHTRGGVPPVQLRAPSPPWFSPHAWGCTEIVADCQFDLRVFPTRVGVYRLHARPRGGFRCFPHTRGGVPPRGIRILWISTFSPHAWGCTVPDIVDALEQAVFPTRVGVYLPGPYWCVLHP